MQCDVLEWRTFVQNKVVKQQEDNNTELKESKTEPLTINTCLQCKCNTQRDNKTEIYAKQSMAHRDIIARIKSTYRQTERDTHSPKDTYIYI